MNGSENSIEFLSQGAMLRGVLLIPVEFQPPFPTVVMAHGTSATFAMVAIEYARALCRSGFAALIYDHRNLGRSDGEPRQEINPWIQCRGYIDALNFACKHEAVDKSRLALWGESFSGGEVLVVAACDRRVGAVVAQCPVIGSSAPPFEPNIEHFQLLRETLEKGDVGATTDHTTGPLPVVSPDQVGTPSLLTPIQAFRWFIDYGGRPGSRWENRVTRVLPPTAVPYSPFLSAPFVEARVLLIVAPDDEMPHCNYQVTRQAFNLMPGPKHWHDIAGGHFGLIYHPGEIFEESAAVQIAFLRQWSGS
jgi:pimeloyl-ACP methyl ester carboxylesterase